MLGTLLVLTGCGGDGRLSPMASGDRARIDELAREIDAPGVWVNIEDPSKGRYTQAYGEALVGGRRAGITDRVRIGSVTKTFTATVVLKLVADRKLELDAPARRYMPDLPEDFGTATIRELLAMGTRIPDYAGVIARDVAEMPFKVYTTQELIGVAAALPRPRQPSYSNTNYVILGEIARRVTGRPLGKLIAQWVTSPLDLDARLPPAADSSLPHPSSHGYVMAACAEDQRRLDAQVAAGTDVTGWSVSSAHSAGAMDIAFVDLGRWAATSFGNELLPSGLRAARLRTDQRGFGFGIARRGDWYGFQGEILGWQTLVFRHTPTGTVVAISANNCGLAHQLWHMFATLYPSASAR